MNTEKFFEAFTELDDDLIENALPKAREAEVVRPAERVRLWKPLAAAAAAVVVVCGIAVGIKIYSTNKHVVAPADSVSEDDKSQIDNSASSNAGNSNVNYSYIEIDEQVYFSSQELVNKSDIAVMGKVTDISFELHDKHTGELLTEYSEDACLCTIYDVDVKTSYKGDENEKVRIIMYNGLEDYEVGKQLKLVGEHYIPVLENPVDIILGGQYLFILSQSTSQSSTGSTMTCLLNHCQGAFRADQPTVKERYSNASLNDIVELLTKSNGRFDTVNVIHNSQYMSLSDRQYTTLSNTVLQAVTAECLPDVQLNMVLSDQRIKEYGKTGYSITIQYQPTYGAGSDKMARGICSVTVLIGKDGEPSYITYSYILDGTSERHDGGTYALSDSSRGRLLHILGDPDSEGELNGIDPYPDDKLFPKEWLRLDSRAKFADRIAEAMASDTTTTDPEEAVKALLDRNMFFICFLYGSGDNMFDVDGDSPRDYSDYEFPIYPCTSKLFPDVKTISDLAYDTYSDSSVADSILYGYEHRPRLLEIDGQMYINNSVFPLRGGVAPFSSRSYIEITEKSDDKCTFIMHYPDLEMLSQPESGYVFHYYKYGVYTAERIDGRWKLKEFVIDHVPDYTIHDSNHDSEHDNDHDDHSGSVTTSTAHHSDH